MATELFTNLLVNDPNLLCYWRMEGNSTDYKGNYNGTDTSMTYSSSEKMFGQCAVFNGSSGYITLASGMANFTTGITISFWAKPTAVGNWARFVDFGAANGAGNANIVFCRESTTNTLLWECGNGTTYTVLRVTNGIILNEWHFYTASVSANGISCLYRDGVLLNSASSATLPQNVSRATNYIGKSNWADALYQGYMDDVAIFNRALTSMEVATLYNLTINNYLTIDSQGSRRSRFPGNITGIEGQNGSGGIVTYDGNYIIHTFTSSGTFVCPGNGTAEVLVVAGGGGGGNDSWGGGGGGAGGFVYNSAFTIIAGTFPVTVGSGGIGSNTSQISTNGGNSVFSTLTALGGGRGGGNSASGSRNGGSGGSGGGAGSGGNIGGGTAGQGYNGGDDIGSTGGGGGGGAGAVGSNAPGQDAGGNGGVGISTYSSLCALAGIGQNISGTYWICGGGGAGGWGAAGSGGAGGGGGGNATSGTANTGGGGGGQRANIGTGGSGGSGVVIIRYLVNSLQL